jgi:hypothetical protein
MTAAVAALNVVVGLVYVQYGTMTAIEMRRNWREMGWSRFGIAWMLMAFTCGPHHLVHGIHIAAEGRPAGGLDLVASVIALPAAVTWFWLRVEVFRGGRGDRFVYGSPLWILAMPTAFCVYVTVVVMTMIHDGGVAVRGLQMAIPNLLLVGTYGMVGLYLTRTQLHNRRPLGGWSLSGLSLTLIFATCSVMHAVFAVYTLRGIYPPDAHHVVVDWLGVPAGLYFLYVVRSLYRGSATDWNRTRAPRAVPPAIADEATPVALPARPAPPWRPSRAGRLLSMDALQRRQNDREALLADLPDGASGAREAV